MTQPSSEQLAAEIDRLRSLGIPARSGRIRELFDYLAERSLEGTTPKEAEIAHEVFGRDLSNDADDSSVRVYIHRLRKRLEDHYLRETDSPDAQITIPLGEYQLALSTVSPKPMPDDVEASSGAVAKGWGIPKPVMALVAIVLALNLLGWAYFSTRSSGEMAAQTAPVWQELVNSDKEVILVLGDYYIVGEFEDGLFLERLIRDFDINSALDLDARKEADPESYQRYQDISLEYLPVSTAFALNTMMPVLKQTDYRIVLASQFEPEFLKCCDIVYLGLTSGLGALESYVFQDGTYKLGATYDEIMDTETKAYFVSEAFLAAPGEALYRDYAVFSVSPGPSDNQIWALTGTRDTGLVGISEALMAKGAPLQWSATQPSNAQPYAALFEITGQKHLNLNAKLLSERVAD
ncbi:MAG: hypothetical protein CMK07_07755 [Ponticaulis sp.]|nr:hypothetical protein [Ponticaulis sp.]